MGDVEGEAPDALSAPVSTTQQSRKETPRDAKSYAPTVRNNVQSGGQQTWVNKLVGLDEVKNWMETLRMVEAEYWGTFFLVFFGVIICVKTYGEDLVAISLTFGLAVATMAQIFGHVSGAHLNPAVSFGLVAAGECGIIKASIFFVVQVIASTFGAFAAAMLIGDKYWKLVPKKKYHIVFYPDPHGITNSLSGPSTGLESYEVAVVEFLITAPLIFTICAVCDKDRKDVKGSAPLAIGFAIAVGHLAAAQIEGASMNPARSIGPLVVSHIFEKSLSAETDHNAFASLKTATKYLWAYLLGPTLGGVFAGLLYRFRFAQKNIKVAAGP